MADPVPGKNIFFQSFQNSLNMYQTFSLIKQVPTLCFPGSDCSYWWRYNFWVFIHIILSFWYWQSYCWDLLVWASSEKCLGNVGETKNKLGQNKIFFWAKSDFFFSSIWEDLDLIPEKKINFVNPDPKHINSIWIDCKKLKTQEHIDIMLYQCELMKFIIWDFGFLASIALVIFIWPVLI